MKCIHSSWRLTRAAEGTNNSNGKNTQSNTAAQSESYQRKDERKLGIKKKKKSLTVRKLRQPIFEYGWWGLSVCIARVFICCRHLNEFFSKGIHRLRFI